MHEEREDHGGLALPGSIQQAIRSADHSGLEEALSSARLQETRSVIYDQHHDQ